ncbi:phospholipase, patatin family [Trichinella nativa]|uniref:Phospholipase, patatin family n=1 Tax=Trichinella nativa TaxID=6335 RepID=A0A1Y3EKX8_9BILA|nr:phospholipase, patatin family [Trichinella nativa]
MKPTPNILEEQNLALSFCGCGFLGVYHLGSAVCFKRYGPSLLKRFSRTGGASAGSLVSALLVCNDSKLIECYHDILELANIVRNLKYGLLTPGFSLHKHLRMLIEKYISDDSHSKADGKVFISVSNFTSLTNKLISQYRSKEDLVNSLLASCYIPFFSGIWEKPPIIDGTVSSVFISRKKRITT